MKISVLCDNTCSSQRFACEHGLAVHVDVGGRKFLFDTGQINCFYINSFELGIDLGEIDCVVLSHGHYDHSGGLALLMEHFPRTRIVMHPHALKTRYSVSSVMTKENGFPHVDKVAKWKGQIRFVSEKTELMPGVSIFSLHQAAPPNHRLVEAGADGTLTYDTFLDELFVVITHNNRTVLLTGCAHQGIVNVLEFCRSQLNISSFDMVLGGVHLSGATSDDIDEQIELCRGFHVGCWALNHCTGESAFHRWCQAFPGRVAAAGAGTVFEITSE